MKKTTILIAALLSLLLLMAGCEAIPAPPATQPPTETAAAQGASAPAETAVPERIPFGDFTAQDINGAEFTQEMFADYDLTMINIWATFCGPCLNEMPDLGELAAEYADQGLQIAGIVVDVMDQTGNISASQVDLAKEIVSQTGANYTHLLPSTDLIKIKLSRVTAVPETVFVDKNGGIVGKSISGSRSKADWEAIIDAYLQEVK